LGRTHTRDRLDQNGDLPIGTHIHAARQRDAHLAALEAPLASAFQFGSQPMARILSVNIVPATAFLADEDYRPTHRRFDILHEPLRSQRGLPTALEELNGALVLLSRSARWERAEIPPAFRLWIDLAGI
jgi:hypothetical protein